MVKEKVARIHQGLSGYWYVSDADGILDERGKCYSCHSQALKSLSSHCLLYGYTHWLDNDDVKIRID